MTEAWSAEHLRKWKFSLLLPVLAVLVYLGRSGPADLLWRALDLAWHLTLPTLLFYGWMKSMGVGAEEDGKVQREPGPLSFIPYIKVRYFLAIVVLPGLGFVNWNMQKFTYSAMGPAVNATISAGMGSKDFVKSVASFVLLPMVSMVTASSQASDHTRTLQIVGTGLGIAVCAGVTAQCLLLTFAKPLMGLFEGNQPLLPNAHELLRAYCMAFVCSVLNETMMAVLAGTRQYLIIGESILPMLLVSLTNSTIFSMGWIELQSTLFIMSLNEVFFSVVLGSSIVATVQRARRGRLEAALAGQQEDKDGNTKALLDPAEPQPGIMALISDLEPSREVLHEMVSASGNTSVRNLALRLKPFFSGMSATRMGNVHGSTFAIQQTLTAYLAGPAGSSGLFTANVAPTLLHVKSFGFFIVCLKAIFCFLIVASGVWFLLAAYGGPQRVLRFGGILARESTIGNASDVAWNSGNVTWMSADWNSTANLTAAAVAGNRTASVSMQGDVQDYLEVLSPLNHWLWAFGTMANEIAAPLDGVLMVLDSYGVIGALYAADFLLVLCPALYAAHRAGTRGACVLPGFLPVSGCNSFTGVLLAGLLWGVARLVVLVWAVFWREVPKLERRKSELACSKELVQEYMDARCNVSPEEVAEHKENHRKNFLYRFGQDAPLHRWASEHGTCVEAMTDKVKECWSDPAMAAGSCTRFWAVYGDWM